MRRESERLLSDADELCLRHGCAPPGGLTLSLSAALFGEERMSVDLELAAAVRPPPPAGVVEKRAGGGVPEPPEAAMDVRVVTVNCACSDNPKMGAPATRTFLQRMIALFRPAVLLLQEFYFSTDHGGHRKFLKELHPESDGHRWGLVRSGAKRDTAILFDKEALGYAPGEEATQVVDLAASLSGEDGDYTAAVLRRVGLVVSYHGPFKVHLSDKLAQAAVLRASVQARAAREGVPGGAFLIGGDFNFAGELIEDDGDGPGRILRGFDPKPKRSISGNTIDFFCTNIARTSSVRRLAPEPLAFGLEPRPPLEDGRSRGFLDHSPFLVRILAPPDAAGAAAAADAGRGVSGGAGSGGAKK